MVEINGTILIQIVNFFILLLVLDRLFFKKLVRVINERRDYVEGIQRDIAQRLTGLEEAQRDYQARLDQARQTAHQALQAQIKSAESEKQQLLNEVAKEVQAQLDQVKTQVSGQIAEARTVLEKETQALADSIADKVLEVTRPRTLVEGGRR